MRRLAVFLSAVVLGLGMARAQDKVINVYNWSDYVDPQILEDFRRETGIRVVYDTFDTNEILETKLLAGGSGYDVMVPTATFLSRQIKAGVFRKLDKTKLPNLKNAWDFVRSRLERYDPGNQYAVDYMWGTTGLGYNVRKIRERMADAPLDSWRLALDPDIVKRFADCGIYMLDAPEDVLPAVLVHLGLDPNSKKPEDIDRAVGHLARIRPYIRKFHSSEYINALANGDICLVIAYSGDVLQARKRAEEARNGVEIAYAIPKEGAQMWFDVMAVPQDAPHPDAAHAFIDYMLRPEVAARASNFIRYANGNVASQPLLDPELRNNPSVYPTEEVLTRLFTIDTFDPKLQRLVTRAWTRLKTGS